MNQSNKNRAFLRATGILAVLAVAFIGVELSVKQYQYQILEHYVEDIKVAAQAVFAEPPASILSSNLQDIIRLPSVTGIEVFSQNGKRIGAYGEALEIVGYRLAEIQSLRHVADANTRYEAYWSAAALDGTIGIAIRIDQSAITAGDRVMVTKIAIILASAVLLCSIIIYGSCRSGN
jgi:hypothetical protein